MTDEQWEQLKPFALEKVRVEENIRLWGLGNAESDPRRRAEVEALKHRYDIELRLATRAYDQKKKELFGDLV